MRFVKIVKIVKFREGFIYCAKLMIASVISPFPKNQSMGGLMPKAKNAKSLRNYLLVPKFQLKYSAFFFLSGVIYATLNEVFFTQYAKAQNVLLVSSNGASVGLR